MSHGVTPMAPSDVAVIEGLPLAPPRPIRVLHVVSTFEVKTDTKWLLTLLRRRDTHRCIPSIACLYGGGPMQANFESIGVPATNWEAPGELDLRAIHRAYREIRRGQFDVVHTHLLRADLYAGLAGKLAGHPAVVSTAYAIGEYRRDKKRLLDGMLDQLIRLMPDHVLAVSKAVRDDCIRRLRCPKDSVSVIHTGIEPADYVPTEELRRQTRQQWGLQPSTPLIVTVARLSYEKGISVLIEAMGRLVQRHPEVVAAVVGDGPLKAELSEQVRQAGLDGRVRLVGFRSDIAAVLAGADIFCLPSYMEGLPNVLLEASSAGLPVVATHVGGVGEVIQDGQTGLLVPSKRPDLLAEGLDRLLSDRPMAQRLAQAGRRRIEQHFSAEVVARKYQGLYETLVARKHGFD